MLSIPKICHLYWDKTPMSWLQTITVSSFHRYNPDWKIIVYVPPQTYSGNQRFTPNYLGKDYFHLITEMKFVEIKPIDLQKYNVNENLHDILRSDIFRYKILYEVGGIWTDFDVVWMRPLSWIYKIDYLQRANLDNMSDTVCMYKQLNGHHNISVMIHKQNSEFIKSLILKTDEIQTKLGAIKLDHQTFGTVMLNSMYPNFSNIEEHFHNVIPLKYETIFPYSIFNMAALYNFTDLSYINNNVLCVHWFNGHTLSKNYVNVDIYNQNCSMTNILKNENWI